MSSVPELYDPWGPLARDHLHLAFVSNGAVYPPWYKPSTGELIIPNRLYLFSQAAWSNIQIEAGTYAVPAWASLVVKIPPSVVAGSVVVPEVVAWDGTDVVKGRRFPHRDYIVLGARDGNTNMFQWIIPPPPDKWHVIGDAGEPGFFNGWAHYSTAVYEAGRFRKDRDGAVHLGGLLLSPNANSAGGAITTLPAGYRPDKTLLRHMVFSDNTFSRVDIVENGNIVNQSAANINTYSSLGDLGMPWLGVL